MKSNFIVLILLLLQLKTYCQFTQGAKAKIKYETESVKTSCLNYFGVFGKSIAPFGYGFTYFNDIGAIVSASSDLGITEGFLFLNAGPTKKLTENLFGYGTLGIEIVNNNFIGGLGIIGRLNNISLSIGYDLGLFKNTTNGFRLGAGFFIKTRKKTITYE